MNEKQDDPLAIFKKQLRIFNEKRNAKLKEFQDFIGYEFEDISLLKRALTTKMYGNQNHIQHFEGMDTVGDALLKFILILDKHNQGECNRELLNAERRHAENDNLTPIGIEKNTSLDCITNLKI